MKDEQEVRRSFLKRMLAGSAVIAGSIGAVRSAKAKPRTPVARRGDEVLYKRSAAFKKYYDSL